LTSLQFNDIDSDYQNQKMMTSFFLPPPHDPRKRALLFSSSGWEVRAFAEDNPLRGYLVSRGFWHLQLWHPEGISILTPFKLTAFRFEASSLDHWRQRADTYEELSEKIAQSHHITTPGPMLVNAAQRWFVARINAAFKQNAKRSPHA
jgi:hypothetical protein